MKVTRIGFFYNTGNITIPLPSGILRPQQKIHSSHPDFESISQFYEPYLLSEYNITPHLRSQYSVYGEVPAKAVVAIPAPVIGIDVATKDDVAIDVVIVETDITPAPDVVVTTSPDMAVDTILDKVEHLNSSDEKKKSTKSKKQKNEEG